MNVQLSGEEKDGIRILTGDEENILGRYKWRGKLFKDKKLRLKQVYESHTIYYWGKSTEDGQEL